MKIVVDSNRIIAGLLKDNTTRAILLNQSYSFYCPSHMIDEIKKHKTRLLKKMSCSETEFEVLFSILMQNITIIKKEIYKDKINSLRDIINDIDDIPFIACSVAVGAAGIWTHDTHFSKQSVVKIFTNYDLL